MDTITARRGKHLRAPKTGVAAEMIGTDGLTDSERRQFLGRFRAGVGSKPANDEHWQHRAEIMADKLADSGRTVIR